MAARNTDCGCILAELVERRRGGGLVLAAVFVAAFFTPQVGHLGRQVASLDLVQVGENRLLMQPVRRAIDFARRPSGGRAARQPTLTPRGWCWP